MTKKEFNEMADVHIYGKGKNRRVRLYFDWSSENGCTGYKYMLKGYGVTKKQILSDGYDILIMKVNSLLCWYDMKVANTDQERFKVSLVG
jgi:hypothetical protein